MATCPQTRREREGEKENSGFRNRRTMKPGKAKSIGHRDGPSENRRIKKARKLRKEEEEEEVKTKKMKKMKKKEKITTSETRAHHLQRAVTNEFLLSSVPPQLISRSDWHNSAERTRRPAISRSNSPLPLLLASPSPSRPFSNLAHPL